MTPVYKYVKLTVRLRVIILVIDLSANQYFSLQTTGLQYFCSNNINISIEQFNTNSGLNKYSYVFLVDFEQQQSTTDINCELRLTGCWFNPQHGRMGGAS